MSVNGIYRVYYKLDITLKSSLSIGSGANDFTDHDVIVDANGIPFIPATAIAGVLRSYISKTYGNTKEDEVFGFIPTEKDSEREEKKSQLRFFDALYTGKKNAFFIANRDCVKLKNKISVTGAKFDMQVVEPGATFTSYIELFVDCEDLIESAISALNAGVIRIGSKTTRGYGQVSVKAYKKCISTADEWLEFDVFENSCWKAANEIVLNGIKDWKISLGLKSTGGISIREYTTEVSTEEKVSPDYKTISLRSGDKNPVIPGTSIAGAFRSRMAEFVTNPKEIENWFGFVIEKEKTVQKSKIVFDEVVLSGGEFKAITRNAINRFTGATKQKSLYTECTYYFGEGELTISFTEKPNEDIKRALLFTLLDLHNGLLSVGGLVSVGRGLFEITSVNGKTIDSTNIENALKEGIADAL